MCTGIFLVALILVLVRSSIKVVMQYERGVVFQLGKFKTMKEPGLVFLVPILQKMEVVDMRIKTAEVPRQEAMTKDNISVLVNAVVYFKVVDPKAVIVNIQDYAYAIRQYTQAALRDVIGNQEMDFVLTEREAIATDIRAIVESETSEWGLDVESIKIQEIELPAEMKRAMAKQAEAERERRAMIIASEGELKAADNLNRAAEILAANPGALHLRTLQTIRDIATDPSEKIVLFMPNNFGEAIAKVIKE
ncbi:MAG TPA: slipin family protein [Chloroflexi bacterium]|nr:slipin family protein [Chloroflexota bacterium]